MPKYGKMNRFLKSLVSWLNPIIMDITVKTLEFGMGAKCT